MTPGLSFSIIIPTYQRRDAVCEAIRALCRQSYDGPMELIVVVDGSTDGTAAALAKLECSFPIKIVEQENGGLASARNRGALEATGDTLLFLDDDLISERDLVRQHAKTHAQGADVVTGEIPVHQSSKPGLVTDALAKAAAWKRNPPLSAFDVYGGHLSIRRSAFRQVGGFDEDLHAGGYGGEDLDLGLRLIGRFDVRHNTDAIAWQKSLVSPFEHMRRARRIAASDLRLIAKHPEVTAELLTHRGAPTRLSRVPALPAIAATVAASLAEAAMPTPLRSSPLLARIYFAARSMSYWSAFQSLGGKDILRKR